MSFSIGIVGLPNVGKSTLFKALTKKQVEAANYPFCTIEPNIGCVHVPDDRLTALSDLYNSEKIIPTTINFVDIAGLVKGAHQGEGLGNKFLQNIREVDAICHVVRDFTDNEITHVHGKIDPKNDIEVIELELVMADLQTVTKRLDGLEKMMRGKKEKELEAKKMLYEQIKNALDSGQKASSLHLEPDEIELIKDLNLLTIKPMMYIYNVHEDTIRERYAEALTPERIAISAKIESELAELSAEESSIYMEELGITQSGLDRLIIAGYQLLNLITFITAGPKEIHAWTVTNGSTAPQAAGKIHSDFEKGFIRAEVVSWKELITYGEIGCKEKGLLRIEGKEYLIKDGDVCHFRFAT